MTKRQTIKTLFLFEEVPSRSFFFELEGDHSEFNEIYINNMGEELLQQKLTSLIYDQDTGALLIKELKEPTRDWTHFVKCGFIL